jgi:hypothetical protein
MKPGNIAAPTQHGEPDVPGSSLHFIKLNFLINALSPVAGEYN